jgi:hypothetical protein
VSDEPITQEKIDDLLAKLRATPDLEDNQRALLEAMITMVSQMTERVIPEPLPEFRKGFDDAFTPGKASALLGFDAEVSRDSVSDAGSTKRAHIADYVTRTPHP